MDTEIPTKIEYDIYPLTKSNEKARNPRTGRYYLSAKYRKYEIDLKWITLSLLGMSFKPLTGNVKIWLVFMFPDKHRRDVQNYLKSFLDSQNGVVWKDDSQVIEIHLKKCIGRAGIVFEFEEVK